MSKKYTKNYCSKCVQETRHEVLYLKKVTTGVLTQITCYSVVECQGCNNISFRYEEHRKWHIVKDDYGRERYHLIVENYPSILRGHRELHSLYILPQKIRDIYEQTILAFKGKSYLLAAVGFRAVIEAVCLHENIKGQNLEKSIDSLAKGNLITERDASRLHSIRFLGNDSVHEIKIPETNKLYLVLEVVESLLKSLYIFEANSKFVLDTVINSFSDFHDILWRCAETLPLDAEKTLQEILGRNIRRIKLDLAVIEPLLINGIKNKEIKFLKLGTIKPTKKNAQPVQHYYFSGEVWVIDDLPF